MKEMKRVLALMLCFVMLVGVVPVGAFAAEAEPAEEEQLIEIGSVSAAAADANDGYDFLLIAADRSDNTAVIGDMIRQVESEIGANELDYLALGGDMVAEDSSCSSSEILGEVTAATPGLSASNVDIVAGAVDANVSDDVGIVLACENGGAEIFEGKRFYVYGVAGECDSEEAQAFVNWAEGEAVDKSKVIVVVSYAPLHGGNDAAYAWHDALNAVATDDNGKVVRDILFFHGHGEGTEEYLFDVEDHMPIQNGEDTVYYTYVTAGYLNRNETATLVTIDDAGINLDKFTVSGFAQLTELVRADAEQESAPAETEPVLTDIKVVNNKAQYVIGDELDITVYAVYSDGTELPLAAGEYVVKGFDSSKVGTMSVYVTWGNYTKAIMVTVAETAGEPVLQDIRVTYTKDLLLGAELELAVAAVYSDGSETPLAPADYTVTGYNKDASGTQGIIVTYGEMSFGFDVTVWIEDPATGAGVAGEGVTGVTITDKTGDELVAAALEGHLYDGFRAYDITPENYTDGTEAKVSLPIPEGVTNAAVFYVSDDGETVTDMNAVVEDGKVVFTTDHFSIYVVGSGTEIEVPDPNDEIASGEITEKVNKTMYKLVTNIYGGNQYLIASGNSGNVNLFTNNDGSIANTTATVRTGDGDGDGTSETYIELTDADNKLWTVSSSNDTYRFENNFYNLRYNGDRLTLDFNDSTAWSYNTNNHRLSFTYRTSNYYSTTYYLRYNNGWTITDSSNASGRSIYFFIPVVYEAEEDVPYTGTYSIKGTPSAVKQVAAKDATITLGSTLTFKYSGGTKETLNPTGVMYTVAEGGDPNGVISGIDGNVLTFSGNSGKALVQISYEVTLADGSTSKVTNYITVDAAEPYNTVQIHEYPWNDEIGENVVGKEITSTVVVKEVDDSKWYDLWPVVKEYDGMLDETGEDGAVIPDEGDFRDRIQWVISDPDIAYMIPTDKDPEHEQFGMLWFTGKKFGTFEVTVYYMDATGEKVLCEDTITISATDSPYAVEGDGIADFPEYPMEGAVRINKTADAVGNFSETGLAKVELSMTGVPYSAGNEIDVVIMIDMSTSMDEATNDVADRVKPAREAAVSALETIVTNEDGSINQNRVAIYTFNGYNNSNPQNYAQAVHEVLPMGAYTKTSLPAAKSTVSNWIQINNVGSGTNYGAALNKCYTVLNEAREEYPERKQFVIFVTDGEPTTGFAYVDGDGYKDDGYNSNYSNGAAELYYNKTEYFSTQMKAAGAEVYTVGIQLETNNAKTILEKIAGTKDGNAYDGEPEADYADYAQFIDADESADKLVEIFENIVNAIKEAATDVQVVDKVGSNYTMNFKLPNNVSAEKAEGMTEFYIQVVEYTLNEDKERTGDPLVKEKFTFSAVTGDLISHTSDKGADCAGDCLHVTTDDSGNITAINGDYFQYINGTYNGEKGEFITWNEEKISTTELALQYFAYLDNSAGYDVEDQIEAGSYYTNDYAYVTYTNFRGIQCQKEFHQPQMTWSGAQVTYLFYLVNDQGNPVNRAGREIPFANAIFVTDPVTESITWYSNDGRQDILASDLLASAKVPNVYELYDKDASYVIRVYETEGVDKVTNAVNYNYFEIDGSDTIGNKETTIVYNNKAAVDARYSEYGVYSKQAKETVLDTTDKNGNPTTVTVTHSIQNIDFSNTTVAFAVVWKPELEPDTIVVDYGMDVIFNVISNDNMTAGVTGLMMTAPNVATDGTYLESVGKNSVADEDGMWTASVESGEAVRFHQNNMLFTKPAEFYYEAKVSYYQALDDLRQTHMYSSVTVIPATTVYYEDDFVTLSGDGWSKAGSTVNATQNVDRPGYNSISQAYDKNNPYGYDTAYDSSSTHSLGSAAKATISGSDVAKAEFTFYGTGFDIFSVTSSDTGVITVKVFDENGTRVKATAVDTYYGYTYGQYDMTYTWVTDQWQLIDVAAVDPNKAYDGELPTKDKDNGVLDAFDSGWTVTIRTYSWQPDPGVKALYQVPVIKVNDLPYGKYSVVITAAYNELLDHNEKDKSYDFYLDAIRIYDPTGVASGSVTNETIENAYVADKEGWPKYQELRDLILNTTQTGSDVAKWDGLIFIDNTADNLAVVNDQKYQISDYLNYGPNNELYLAPKQSIAFTLTVPAGVADVQIGMKSADGSDVIATLTKYANGTAASSSAQISETTSATERYYSIGNHVPAGGSYTLSIKNNGSSGILSITNIKTTYDSKEASANEIGIGITKDTASAVLMMMNESAADSKPAKVLDADLEVSIRNTSVKAGSNVVVKATTTADAAYLVVNGQKVTKFTENKTTGERSWSVSIKAAEAGDMEINVTAYSDGDKVLESVSETVEVAENKTGVVQQIVGQLVGMLNR